VGQNVAIGKVMHNFRSLALKMNSCPVLLAKPGCGASMAARVLHRAGMGGGGPVSGGGGWIDQAAGEHFFASVGAG
jgi:hypothetical protein